MNNPQQRAWFRALDHARSTGVKPWWRVGDYYTVDSPGTRKRYEIRRINTGHGFYYSCTCPGMDYNRVCWHRALVAALPYEVKLRQASEADMKLELKVAGGKIQEPGYYGALCIGAEVKATGKVDQDGTNTMLLELHCNIQYQGEEVQGRTSAYLTLSPDSKLTQLLLATGYANDFDSIVARYTAQGLDSDFFPGKSFRILYANKTGANGRTWVTDTGYAPLSKKPTFGPGTTPVGRPAAAASSHDEDDIAF
jgi:hypothetical protein